MDNLFFQIQKAIEICSSFERYRLVKFSPLKINCRCPVCGDSEKSKIKARFWVNQKDGELLTGCFNCNFHSNFTSFCKDYFPDTFKELMFHKYNQSNPLQNAPKTTLEPLSNMGNGFDNINRESALNNDLEAFSDKIYKWCTEITKLPENHPILGYIKKRQIPEEFYSYFFFTTKWQDLVHDIQEESYKNPRPENRLVMVIKDFNNKITAFQGRSLDPNARNKYITIKEHQDSNKIFGLDRVDLSKPVFLMEGIVDSLFIDNSVAITGGSLEFNDISIPKDKRVFVLDNEPAAPHTIQRIQKAIDANEQVVLFDKVNWKSKDVNDLIIKEKISKEEVNCYLKENIISGLSAKLRFSNWRKV